MLLSYLTYYAITSDETEDFQTEFSDFADKVIDQFLEETQLKVWLCYSLSLAYTSEFEDSGDWPNVSLKRFEVKTLGATDMARASSIAFSPLVTDEERSSWESYAANIDPMLKMRKLNGTADEAQPSSSLPTVETMSQSDYNVKDGIYRIENGTIVSDKGSGPYFPLWQIAPVMENVQAVMFNQMSVPSRAKAISSMMEDSSPVLSEVFYQDTYDQAKDEAAFETRGVLFFPVFDHFAHGSVVGAVSTEFNWEDNFRNILPAHSKGIICVLENTCDQVFTYKIEGKDAIFLGTGDLHNTKYNDMEESTTYTDFLHAYNASAFHSSGGDTSSGVAQDERKLEELGHGCLYSLHLYPSAEFESIYITQQPVWYAGFVMLIFAFAAIVFIAYDCLVSRRQNEVTATAARANAIVDSLFPAMVRERVFQSNESRARAREGQGAKNVVIEESSSSKAPRRLSFGSGVKGDTPKKRLTSFLRGRSESYAKMEETIDPMADPIADLFPDTTIMFADIAGFTAWSSEREPSQVFQLLESVYYAFDAVARQMKVFKLETIGDCYVAATGLPEPDKDHAVNMTRFAFECLQRMKETTRKLETSLGPGTSDLTIRVGLHSGPVTGGVLRGEKSRFQLFGDTMNTAARMESNGKRDMIQISEATAELLVQAGKDHWLTPREDPILAKGKGEMKTFWIMPRNMTVDGDSNEIATSDDASVGSASVASTDNGSRMSRKNFTSFRVNFRKAKQSARWGSMSLLEDTVGVKNARLVDWNVEQLLALLTKVVIQRRASDPHLPPGANPNVKLTPTVRAQLQAYVGKIESLYRDVPFHNFEHTSHVTMSVNKLMKRIVDGNGTEGDSSNKTFGISDDPMIHFAVVFSALVVDVDHRGVPNEQLIKERDALALKYKNKSVVQQNSIKLAWETLKEDGFEDLRDCIYQGDTERYRFRQLVANAVMATDIKEPKLQAVRKKRWSSVFRTSSRETEVDTDTQDRKAKLVIEHVMQAANVAHTMQHWSIYIKWNERLYQEMYEAYKNGRADEDPSIYWYEDELRFLDNHVIPLAKKLKECGVFGDSGDEYLEQAGKNRKEWEMKGKDISRERIEKLNESGRIIDGS
jgi:class 3 adenylate cyclase